MSANGQQHPTQPRSARRYRDSLRRAATVLNVKAVAAAWWLTDEAMSKLTSPHHPHQGAPQECHAMRNASRETINSVY